MLHRYWTDEDEIATMSDVSLDEILSVFPNYAPDE